MTELSQLPPVAQHAISVILLAYNQEQALEASLRSWTAYLGTLNRDYEIILVDDGSSNHTGELAEALAAQLSRVRLVRHPSPLGPGAALRSGLAVAQHPLFCYAECNQGYQPSDLGKLLEAIDQVHLVSGYRVRRAPILSLMKRDLVYRWFVRGVFGVRLTDVDCEFKLFRRSIFERIPIQSNGEFVHAEILAKANFLGCLMTEVPVEWREGSGTKSSRPNRRSRWAEALRVFQHPDFGPPILPTDKRPNPDQAGLSPATQLGYDQPDQDKTATP